MSPGCICVLNRLSCVWHSVTPWTMGSFRQEYWSGLPFPPPGDLPEPGIEPTSVTSPALAGGFFITSITWEAKCHLGKWGPVLSLNWGRVHSKLADITLAEFRSLLTIGERWHFFLQVIFSMGWLQTRQLASLGSSKAEMMVKVAS